MNDEQAVLARHFTGIGASVRFQQWERPRGGRSYDVNVTRRERGGRQAFVISTVRDAPVEFLVLDRDPADRHLLLVVRLGHALRSARVEKHRFLCGHDEREWFVAAVPDRRHGVTGIESAKDALKPEAVLLSEQERHLGRKERQRRRNSAYLRQGEWFFVPAPDLGVPGLQVLRNEPLRRGSGKPHLAQFLYRRGGTTVYVSRAFPDGLEQPAFNKLLLERPELRRAGWRTMRKNPEVYCRGWIRHPDHKTLVLPSWHRVLPNTEDRAPWMEHLSFLD